jgi:hypothetical protein
MTKFFSEATRRSGQDSIRASPKSGTTLTAPPFRSAGRRCSLPTATRLLAGPSVDRIPVGARHFLYSRMSVRDAGRTQPPIQCVPGFFPGGKAAGA